MKLLFIMGTRPEAIKMAPVILEASKRGFDCWKVSTGQHGTIVEEILKEFDLEGVRNINTTPYVKKPLSFIAAKVLEDLHKGIFSPPDICFVQGDTISTFMGALWAFYNKVPIAHVEAGLRSWDNDSPYPEEGNRKLISQIASYNFCPTSIDLSNLLEENIPKDRCHITGNTVIDAVDMIVDKDYQFKDAKLRDLFRRKKFIPIVMTMHRRENWEILPDILKAVRKFIDQYICVKIVMPVHPNPAIQKIARKELSGSSNVYLVDPLGYSEFINLMARSTFVVTDSGGIQEEAAYIGKPVLVVRRETERVQGVTEGVAKLVGVNPARIVTAIRNQLFQTGDFTEPSEIYGDGTAAVKILDIISGE